tara:strand:- start:148 stop:585 length:438 start_codon:yes stop_codon:yes gene_type:complete
MTFTEITFKASNIKTTGTFLSTSQYVDDVSVDYIKTYLQTYLIMNPLDDVIDRLYIQNPDYGLGLHAGSITKDVNLLLENITSAIALHSVNKFEDPMMAMAFNAAQIEMCSAKDLNTIIENTILNCATQDHFNEFENKEEYSDVV